jgi:hypothetical protein
VKIILKKTWRWIIVISIIAIVAGITIWQLYSYISSDNSLIISDQVEGRKTIIKTSPGEPLKNATPEVRQEIANVSE